MTLLPPCHVHWNGGTKQYTSVLLIGNGLTIGCQTLVFLAVRSLADYGNWIAGLSGASPSSAGLSNFCACAAPTVFAAKQAWQSKQTVAYMVPFFLLCDSVNTTMTLINIARWQAVAFSATGKSYLVMVSGFSSAISGFGSYYVQAKLGLKTKTILQVSNLTSLIVAPLGHGRQMDVGGGVPPHVGVLGHAVRVRAEHRATVHVRPGLLGRADHRGREYLFFGLVGIVSKGSSWIDPVACSAIVDASGNQWMAFPLVAALTLVPTVAIVFISEEKARRKMTTIASEGQLGSPC